MSDLSEFLLARIAEDQAYAQEWYAEDDVRIQKGTLADPARMLAECQAKRRIIELHGPWDSGSWDHDLWCSSCSNGDESYADYPCETLRTLALPYAAHADFREEWRP